VVIVALNREMIDLDGADGEVTWVALVAMKHFAVLAVDGETAAVVVVGGGIAVGGRGG